MPHSILLKSSENSIYILSTSPSIAMSKSKYVKTTNVLALAAVTVAVTAISTVFLAQMVELNQKAYAQEYWGCNPENCDPVPGCQWQYDEFGKPYIDCSSDATQMP